MSEFPQYPQYDALGLAELIRKGEIKSDQVRSEALRRAERLNPNLNAIVYFLGREEEQYLDDVDPQGTFAGIPFLLKDLQHALRGVPMSCGCRAMQLFVPPHDSELVSRWKQAGLSPLGKTNTPELGLMGVTEPELFGPARNPWNTEHSPGGSSGGSAAAVAARIVPLASAGDGGGSIRIPASCCGIFGIKPSRGRMPTGPDYGSIWEGAVADHVLSISVRDSAALLDATHGPDPGAPYLINQPRRSFLRELEHDPHPLRIGFCLQSPVGASVDRECQEAVTRTASLLSSLGHTVEEVPLPYDGELVAECYLRMNYAQAAANLKMLSAIRGSRIKNSELEAATRVLAGQGGIMSAREYSLSLMRWNETARAMGRFHQRFNLLLTPVMATIPPRIGEVPPQGPERLAMRLISSLRMDRLLTWTGEVRRKFMRGFSRMPFTQVANITGQPAVSLPLHWTEQGLPCGVQFIAPMGEEGLLFSLSGQLERATPWMQRKPEHC